MRRIVSVLTLCGIGIALSTAADVADFRKRLAKLRDVKDACEAMSDEAKKSDCLANYEKQAETYKNDYEAFKGQVVLENQKRQERRSSQGEKSIQEDITTRQQSITDFEDFLNNNCDENVTTKCGSALYQLGSLHYKNEEDQFRIAQTNYEQAMQKWEDQDKRGPEPTPVKRNHTRSQGYFERLIREYPTYVDLDKAFYRLAFVYSMAGQDDKEYEVLTKLVTNYKESPLIPSALLRIGEYWFIARQYKKAIEAYDKIPPSYQGPEVGLALYHKAESYYNMADFERAAAEYYNYVIKADKGQIKADLRDEALEFMAASWADLENGVEVADKFLANKNHPWKKDVFFQMGQKNRGHDRFAEARAAYKHLVENDPYYPRAPEADKDIIEMLVIEKKAKEAQEARMQMSERYAEGSAWHRANSSNTKGKEVAAKIVKECTFQIPLYYQIEGTKDTGNINTDALEKSIKYYREYIERYAEPTWELYEVHQNLGTVFSILKRYKESADEYAWCAKVDASKLGRKPEERKDALLTQADASYNRVYMLDMRRQEMVKQMGDNNEQAYTRPETEDYFSAVDEYMRSYGKSQSAPDIAYNSALVHYESKRYGKAIEALQKLVKDFPDHQHARIIQRMLGQSLLENGQYKESEEMFAAILRKTPMSDTTYIDIQLSVASAIFKQADQAVNRSDFNGAASQYLRVVNQYPKVKIADKALFEAGSQYEKGGDIPNASNAFLRIHREYPQSDLKVKGILRAANAYLKANQFRQAGQTFLMVRDLFPKDSAGFLSIGWAAEAYTKIPDPSLAARTYESAMEKFPNDPQTPAFVYNAGQTYEENKDWPGAIRVYEMLGQKYSKSSYALEAVYSVPLIYEKQGNTSRAIESYRAFLKNYGDRDLQKTIRAQLAVAKLLYEKEHNPDEALPYYESVVKSLSKTDGKTDVPPALAAEAAYRAGDIYYNKITANKLDGSPDANKKRMKEMTKLLEQSINYFSAAVGAEEQEWTLRSTLRMGDLFMAMAAITKEEKIQTRDAIRIAGEKINIRRDLPVFYDRAKSLYQKNLDMGREFNIQSQWIDSSAYRYLYTFALKGLVFEEIGQILGSSPIPEGLSEEENEMYAEALKDKIYEAEQAAKPIYGKGLQAAQFYGLQNQVRDDLRNTLRRIDPQAPELSLRDLTVEERSVVYNDSKYKKNLEKITEIANSSKSSAKKITELKKMEDDALADAKKLQAQLDALSNPAKVGQ